jgi:transglutaminase-like putative cysteine protease
VIFSVGSPAPLVRTQLAWLAALVFLSQLPLLPHVPLWVAAAGMALPAARLLLPADRWPSPRMRRWLLPLLALTLALAIRMRFGYLLARDPCVAFLYVLVGIKFAETRSARDGGLLVCLALFLLLTQYFYAQTIGAALVTLPALLVLGGALAALRDAPPPGADWKAPLARTAAMIVQGIPVAAFLFILFPRLAGPLWGMPADAGARTGLSDRMAPGSISALSLSDEVAFRVDFQGPPPPPAQRYWRGPVFSRFDGEAWTPLPWLRRGELAPPRSTERIVEYDVTLEPQGRQWLFALEHPVSMPRRAADGAPQRGGLDRVMLTAEQQLLSRTSLLQAVRYSLRSALGKTFPASGTLEVRENLKLPPERNPRTVAFARELRERAGSDRAFIAAVLQRFRTEPFVYTLAPPLLGSEPVDDFLFDGRRGFCEHYAGAFVVLLRAAGIPARVVTGYQGGEINPDGGYMIVRQSDAHAWAEALLDGVWERFDPTAAVAPSRVERGLGAALPQGEPVPYLARMDMTWLKSLRLHWDAINYQWQRSVVGFNMERQRGLLRELRLDLARPWQIVMVAATGIMLWAAFVLGSARIRARRADPVATLWARACRRLARAGLARGREEGPIAYAARAAARWPRWSTLFASLAESYALLRYGPESDRRDELLAALRANVAALPKIRALRAAA